MKKSKWLFLLATAYLSVSGLVFGASSESLKQGDVLSITVEGEPELTVDRQVSFDGSIDFPLIGSVGVSGLKTKEVEKIIKQQLEDGFLQNPVVSINLKSESSDGQIGNESFDNSDEQILIEVRDKGNDSVISNSVVCIGNKVYQTNRHGQVLINKKNVNSVVIADGYKSVSGLLSKLIIKKKNTNPSYILLEKIPIQKNLVCTIVEAETHNPIKHAEINLDGRQFVANNKGEFKIKDNKKEFSEIIIKKRGYNDLKRIIDYKCSSNLIFELSK